MLLGGNSFGLNGSPPSPTGITFVHTPKRALGVESIIWALIQAGSQPKSIKPCSHIVVAKNQKLNQHKPCEEDNTQLNPIQESLNINPIQERKKLKTEKKTKHILDTVTTAVEIAACVDPCVSRASNASFHSLLCESPWSASLLRVKSVTFCVQNNGEKESMFDTIEKTVRTLVIKNNFVFYVHKSGTIDTCVHNVYNGSVIIFRITKKEDRFVPICMELTNMVKYIESESSSPCAYACQAKV